MKEEEEGVELQYPRAILGSIRSTYLVHIRELIPNIIDMESGP